MSGLLAFMIMVSCSDGFQDCALAQPPQAYASQAACEAKLESALRRVNLSSKDNKDNVLGKCAAAEAGAEHKIYWQVSQSGDLLTGIRGQGEGAASGGLLYAENIAAQGEAAAHADKAVIAENSAADSAHVHLPQRGSKLAFFSNYSRVKQSRSGAEPEAAKYIYETAPAAYENSSASARINVNFDFLPVLSSSAFAIKPQADEEAYSMPPAEYAALHNAPLDGEPAHELPAWQRIVNGTDNASAVSPQNNSAPDNRPGKNKHHYNGFITRLAYMS